jgi:hypothetical protein
MRHSLPLSRRLMPSFPFRSLEVMSVLPREQLHL